MLWVRRARLARILTSRWMSRASVVLLMLAAVGAGCSTGSAQGPRAPVPITIQPNIGAIDAAEGVQFAPDGRYLAVSDGKQIKLWDIGTGLPLRILEHSAHFRWFAIIGGGARILSVHKDGHIRMWDPLSGRVVDSVAIPGLDENIPSVAHHPERKLIAIAAGRNSVRVWDYGRKRQVAEIRLGDADALDAARFSRDGKQLIVGRYSPNADGTLRVFDLGTRRAVRTISFGKQRHLRFAELLDETLVAAKTDWNDCAADIVLVRLAPVRLTTIDKAPGCQGQKHGLNGTTIRLFHDKHNRRLFVAREGVAGFKVWDLAANRDAGVVSGAGWLVGMDHRFTLAALMGEHRLTIVDLGTKRRLAELVPGHGEARHIAVASADGRQMLLHQSRGDMQHFTYGRSRA
jgi:hypothetical protein